MPQDKVGMCKEAPGRSPSYSKGAGAKEPTSHNRGQTRQALHWTPQDKRGHARKKLQEEALYTAKAGARRPFKWNEDQNGIDTNKGVPSCQNKKARYMEQKSLQTRNTTKSCQQERRATGSSLLNIEAKIHPIKRVSEQVFPR